MITFLLIRISQIECHLLPYFPDELTFSVLYFQWDAERVTKLTASVNVFTKMIVLKDVSVWKWNLKVYLFVQNCVNQKKRKKHVPQDTRKMWPKTFFLDPIAFATKQLVYKVCSHLQLILYKHEKNYGPKL